MHKLLGNSLIISLAIISNLLLLTKNALAFEPERLTNKKTLIPESIAQVNSVSQLADVQPTDWAFIALQSLVERYGCIAGYPNSTYRGNRPLSRYEFAAGLNACLDRVSELITTATSELVTKEDLATLQKLQEEFAAELATLRGKVDVLEVRSAQLEANQFSTTTKLNGEVITHVADAFGDDTSSANNTILTYRVRLNFDTSFTGSDRLRVRLQAANFRLLSAGDPNIDNSTGGFGASQRYASAFPDAFSDEARLLPSPASEGENDSNVRIHDLSYNFPFNDKLNIYIAAGVTDPTYLGADPISPFSEFATGSISNFANSNPIYYPMGQRGGAGLSYTITDSLVLAGGYVGQDVNDIGGPNLPGSSSGIFNGGYTAFGQLTYYSGNLTAGLVYMNTYTPQFGIDTLAGSNSAKVSTGDFSTPFDDRVSANHYGFIANYKLSDRFQLGGWVGYTNARVLGTNTVGDRTGNAGDVKVLNYAVTLAFPDLGAKGNLGGLVFGMQPKVVDTSNDRVAEAIGLPDGRRSDRDTGFHIEAFYRFQLNENVSVTPGFFWLTAPNHDERNSDAFIGVIRTSFVF
ncbi:iron uptake porin [Fischerella sp. PCC 9605]|uniref:iron uptake porin n=1 Tax=Fischerella sp. PCC 9605 TaxID=1173024 RepID=UPI00047CD774|nr:iron uptake porin [Fischerella sp. PCC 9605]